MFTVVLIYHKVYIIGAEKGLMVKGTVFFFPIIYKGTSIAGFLNTRSLGVDPKANPSFFWQAATTISRYLCIHLDEEG